MSREAVEAARRAVEDAREAVRESGGDTWARVQYCAALERLRGMESEGGEA